MYYVQSVQALHLSAPTIGYPVAFTSAAYTVKGDGVAAGIHFPEEPRIVRVLAHTPARALVVAKFHWNGRHFHNLPSRELALLLNTTLHAWTSRDVMKIALEEDLGLTVHSPAGRLQLQLWEILGIPGTFVSRSSGDYARHLSALSPVEAVAAIDDLDQMTAHPLKAREAISRLVASNELALQQQRWPTPPVEQATCTFIRRDASYIITSARGRYATVTWVKDQRLFDVHVYLRSITTAMNGATAGDLHLWGSYQLMEAGAEELWPEYKTADGRLTTPASVRAALSRFEIELPETLFVLLADRMKKPE